ncbi:MAG TPA: restriction endonuclease subunit S [Terriglobales bacterium]|nr:restriction endonuclease subunit S [Terriglobales bacterium]
MIGSAKQVVKSGDVLLSRIVPHIRRSWVVSNGSDRRTIASGEWIVFRSNRVHPDYLRHVLVGDSFYSEFMRTVSGVGGSLLRARPAYVAQIKIPLPPLAEQRRIAEVLDRADALRAKRRAALAQLDSLTQSIFLDLFGDPVVNTRGWKISTIGEVAERITKGESPKWQGFEYQEEGALFVTSENVRLGELDISSPKFIPLEFHSKLSRSQLKIGDLLVNLVGASIGRSCIFDSWNGPANVNQAVGVITLDKSLIETRFLANLLTSSSGQNLLLGNRVEAARANISLTDLRESKIPLPPRTLQNEFVRRIARVDRQRVANTVSLQQLGLLCSSLQDRAFRGAL